MDFLSFLTLPEFEQDTMIPLSSYKPFTLAVESSPHFRCKCFDGRNFTSENMNNSNFNYCGFSSG